VSRLSSYLEEKAKNQSLTAAMRVEFVQAVEQAKAAPKGGYGATSEPVVKDGRITFKPAFMAVADRRPSHLQIGMALASGHVPYNFAEDPSLHNFSCSLNPKHHQLSKATIQDMHVELYAFAKANIMKEIDELKELFGGLPWGHLTTDMWTCKHSKKSYSSLAIRTVDPRTGEMKVIKLGVLLFTGRHTNKRITKHIRLRLHEFGLHLSTDIASSTTDSGANIRKACLAWETKLGIDWTPCILHGLHNSVKAAMGLCDEKQAKGVGDEAAGSGNRDEQ
jgi:hypothetical protein